ncbi:hypothetical protein L2E82_44273 [Cichorium intybus]|uniref:Uncharacterized protein n=1 Tax=Cichorium intybus TaxID=13427 RepID=A0ACB8ZR18_CICIN|nr:hypothetical protein L2E82_44273 [Cichorium intybus]
MMVDLTLSNINPILHVSLNQPHTPTRIPPNHLTLTPIPMHKQSPTTPPLITSRFGHSRYQTSNAVTGVISIDSLRFPPNITISNCSSYSESVEAYLRC